MQAVSTAGTVHCTAPRRKLASHATFKLDQAQSTEMDSCSAGSQYSRYSTLYSTETEASKSYRYQARPGSGHRDRLLQAQSVSRLPVQSDSTAGTVLCTAQRQKLASHATIKLDQAQSTEMDSCSAGSQYSRYSTLYSTETEASKSYRYQARPGSGHRDRLLQAQTVSRLAVQSFSIAGTVHCNST
jgi:hypothetical protein